MRTSARRPAGKLGFALVRSTQTPGRLGVALLGMGFFPGLAEAQCQTPVWTLDFNSVQSGLAYTNGSPAVATCTQVFDPDGAGPAPESLYVAGPFATAGGVQTSGLASWDGHHWTAVGGLAGPNGAGISVLSVGDIDGAGPQPERLLAGGYFALGGEPLAIQVAAWNGQAWQGIGTRPLMYDLNAIVRFDPDGAGPAPRQLVVVGTVELGLPNEWNVRPFAAWDGNTWTYGPPGGGGAIVAEVYDEDGAGPIPEALYCGTSDWPGIWKFDGTSWSIPGGGLSRSLPYLCTALRVVDEDGPGPARPVLLAGGSFVRAGGQVIPNVAKWDGQSWSSMGTSPGSDVTDFLAVDNPGLPPTIYFSGGFAVGRWERSSQTWTTIGSLATSAPFVPPYIRLALFRGVAPSASVYVSGHHAVEGISAFGLSKLSCDCPANCDGSIVGPVLTANDFMCFINRYAAGHWFANCDGSTAQPLLTANDFQCFINRVASGCP